MIHLSGMRTINIQLFLSLHEVTDTQTDDVRQFVTSAAQGYEVIQYHVSDTKVWTHVT